MTARCIESGCPKLLIEEPQTTPEGKTLTLLSSKIPLRGSDGEISGVLGMYMDITERKRAEEKVRQLSRAVEQNPASIVITDPAGNIEYVNPKFVELSGYASAEVLGQNPRVLKSGEKSPEAYRELWQTIMAGKEWRGEFHNKKKNGELYWESASISPIRDPAGRITHYVAVKEDITAQKQTEAERSRLIRELQEALANVKSLSGPAADLRGLQENPRRPRLLEPGGELYSKALRSPVHARPVPGLHQEALPGAGIVGPLKLMKTAMDMPPRAEPQRQRAEAAPRESERNYRELFDATSDAIFLHDAATGAILDVNQAGLDLFGYSRDELLNLTDAEFRAGGAFSHQEAVRRIRQAAADGPQVFDWQSKRKNGEPFWTEVALRGAKIGGQGRVVAVVRDLTERKRAEQALRQSEEHFRALTEHGMDIITVLEPDGTIRYESPSIQRVFGYTPEELVGRNGFELVHPEDMAGLQELFRAGIARRDESATSEFRFRHKDGSWRVLEAVARNLIHDPSVKGVIVNSRDVTERKQLERALRESSQFNQQIIASAQQGIVVQGRDLKYQVWNPFMEQLTGLPASQVLGKHPDEVFPFLREAGIVTSLQRVLAGEPTRPIEFHFDIPQTGKSAWVARTDSPLRSPGGEIIGAIGIVRNITKRKQAEAEAREREEQFRAMFEVASIGMAQADPQSGRWLRVNQKLCAITGYSADELLQMRIPEITHPEDRQKDWEAFQRVVRGEAPDYHLEKRYLRKDGAVVWVNVNVTVIRDAAGQPTRSIATVEDITERKHAELRVAAFSDLGQKLSAARSAREAAEIIVEVADHLIGWDACSLALYTPGDNLLHHVLRRDTIDGRHIEDQTAYDPSPPYPLAQRVIEQGGQLILKEQPDQMAPGGLAFGNKARPSASILFVPARAGAEVVGVLSIHSYTPKAYDQQSLETLQALANHCAVALKRISAQEALGASEANYRSLVESSPDAIFLHREGKFLYANPASLKLLGAAQPEQILGRSVFDIVPPENHNAIRQRIQQATQGGMSPLLEQKILRLDGTAIDAEGASIPLAYEGRPAVQTIMRDITERKRAELRVAAFSELSQKLSAAQTAKAAARIIVEVADQLLGWDACMCDLYSPEERLLTNLVDIDLVEGRRTECSPVHDHIAPSKTQRRAIEEGGQLILRGPSNALAPDSLPSGNVARRSASLMFVPIRNGTDVIGVLSIQSYTPNAYHQQSLETLQALADHCGAALDRIRTGEALRSSQARLQLQFDHMPLACITWDRDHRVTSWNPAAERIFGYTATEALGKQARGFIVPKQLQPLVDGVGQRLLEGKADLHTVNENQTKDGRAIFCDWTSVPLRSPDGSIVGVLSMVQDVTERKRVEEELRWKTAFLEAQVNSSPDGILLVDKDGKKFLQNQRTIELWKIPPEIAGDPDDAKQVQFVMQQTRNPRQFVERVSNLYTHPTEVSRDVTELTDGTVLDRYSSPVVGKDGTHYGRIWTFRDITESRRLEQQLRQSQKMEAVGQLAGGVAHDFNNMLAVIRGNAELLLMGADQLTAEAGDCLKQVVAAAERAANLTRQLLAFSRKQVMQSRPLILNDVIADLTKMLNRVIREDIRLQCHYAPRLPFIQADAGHDGAGAAQPRRQRPRRDAPRRPTAHHHGHRRISTTPASRPTRRPRAGDFVCLTVSDTGTRHRAGAFAAHLRAVLHHQGTGQGHGAGPGDGLWHRQTARGLD